MRWALEEAGLPNKTRLLEQGDQEKPDHRAPQPFGRCRSRFGKVPVQRCTVHKHRNLLARAPERLREEFPRAGPHIVEVRWKDSEAAVAQPDGSPIGEARAGERSP